MATTRGGGPTPRALPLVLALAAPWSWFAVRDAGALLDVLATGLPAVAAVSAAVALLAAAVLRRLTPLVLAVSILAVGATAILGPWLPASTPAPVRPLRLVAANVLHHNPALGQATADLLGQRGDVVVVVEGALAVYEQLRDDFDFAELGPAAEHVVLSRFPVRLLPPPAELAGDRRVSRWGVAAPGGTVVLYAVHLGRPQVRRTEAIRAAVQRQRREVGILLRAAAEEPSPAIIVGDLNISDRASGYRRLRESMRDAMRAERAGPTYVRPRYRPFLLRIDHLFVPKGFCSAASRRFRIEGSDHRGIVADVGPCPPAGGD